MRNVYTNSRGSISPLQVSKQVPDSILRSFKDIQNTMYNMMEKGLLHKIESNVRVGAVESEEEETQFQISGKGIVQFRKSLRPIAKLVVNHEEYQTIVEQTEGDPEVKAELKELPERITATLGKVPKELMVKIEDKVYDAIAIVVLQYGVFKAGVFITNLIFTGSGGG